MNYRIFQASNLASLALKVKTFLLANNTFQPVQGIGYCEETGRIVYYQVVKNTAIV